MWENIMLQYMNREEYGNECYITWMGSNMGTYVTIHGMEGMWESMLQCMGGEEYGNISCYNTWDGGMWENML